jgi:hypothetical protein
METRNIMGIRDTWGNHFKRFKEVEWDGKSNKTNIRIRIICILINKCMEVNCHLLKIYREQILLIITRIMEDMKINSTMTKTILSKHRDLCNKEISMQTLLLIKVSLVKGMACKEASIMHKDRGISKLI